MDIRQLKYFVAVVEEGSFSKAANTLHISQPPLSMQIRMIEEETGCKMFERTTRKLKLTEEGQLLYSKAKNILNLMMSLENELEEYKEGISGTIHIGVPSSVSNNVFVSYIKKFHQKYPEIKFSVYEGNTYELLEKIRLRQIEMAIVRTPFHAPDMRSFLLKQERLVGVGNAKLFPLPDDMIQLKDLENMPLILYRRWEKIIKDCFIEKDVSMNVFCINDDARTTAAFVNEGLGISIVPESACSLYNSNVRIFEISDLNVTSEIMIIYNKDASTSKIGQLFLDYILK